MRGTSGTCGQTTLEDTRNAIFSAASAAGPPPSVSQDGRTTDQYGQQAVHVGLSARQAKAAGLLTSGTYGRHSSISSASAALSQFLGNRSQTQLGTGGSILFRQTWKEKVTPLGRRYWAHTASVLRTSGSGCSSWASPNTLDYLKSVNWEERKQKGGWANLKDQVTLLPLASWGTPATRDNYKAKSGTSRSKVQEHWRLGNQARLASGPTAVGFGANPNPATQKADGGRLNPEFSLWLMGFPPEWASCGARAMPSSRKSRRNSSERTWSPLPSQLPELQLGPSFTRPPASGAA